MNFVHLETTLNVAGLSKEERSFVEDAWEHDLTHDERLILDDVFYGPDTTIFALSFEGIDPLVVLDRLVNLSENYSLSSIWYGSPETEED